MPVRTPRPPKYRLHKSSGQAVITLSDRDFYLGGHGGEESHAEYRRLIAEWLTSHKVPSPPRGLGSADLTLNRVLAY